MINVPSWKITGYVENNAFTLNSKAVEAEPAYYHGRQTCLMENFAYQYKVDDRETMAAKLTGEFGERYEGINATSNSNPGLISPIDFNESDCVSSSCSSPHDFYVFSLTAFLAMRRGYFPTTSI